MAQAAQSAGQAASQSAFLPSSVIWVGGIAAFLGFIIGSVPFHEDDYGWKFDMQGALMWALAAAGIAGGLTLKGATGSWTPAIFAIGLGALLALGRISLTRGPRVPRSGDLADGVNRGEGDSQSAKWKSAQKMYKHASFHRDSYYAARAPIEWRFGDEGMTGEIINALSYSTQNPSSETFDILLLLVRQLPDEVDQPAVVVVRGGANLRQVRITGTGITVPGYESEIPRRNIAATVGYAWR
jgi:hypothetical protein